MNDEVEDGRVLTFEAEDGTIRDVETGTRWSFDGHGSAGELAGTQLELLVSDSPFYV